MYLLIAMITMAMLMVAKTVGNVDDSGNVEDGGNDDDQTMFQDGATGHPTQRQASLTHLRNQLKPYCPIIPASGLLAIYEQVGTQKF